MNTETAATPTAPAAPATSAKVKKPQFDKEEFKRSIIYYLKNTYRKNLDEATPKDMFQAVAHGVKDMIVDRWIETFKEVERSDAKMVYYLSMEFLMGRALGNSIINLCAQKEIKEALDEIGVDLNLIEDQDCIMFSLLRALSYVQVD